MDDSRDQEDHAIIEMGDAIYEVVMLSMRGRRSQ